MSCITILPLQFTDKHYSLQLDQPVLKDSSGLVLVDCGYPGFLPKIETAMAQAGLQMKDVSKIIITHHDHDHIGALKEIVDHYPGIEVISSTAQKPFLTGKEQSLRLIQAEQLQMSLSNEDKIKGNTFMDILRSIGKVEHVTTVDDGDILPICGGLQVIDTSGHMPGHISLYLAQEKTLIAGDALAIFEGRLSIANPGYALDLPMAIKSVKKLLQYDIEKVICYHGGIFVENVTAALERIVHENRNS